MLPNKKDSLPSRLIMRWLLTILLTASAVTCSADTTIKIRTVNRETGANPNVQNPDVHRTVYYRRGTMRRKDSLNDKSITAISSIANCDSKSGVFIDLLAHEYRIFKVVNFLSSKQLDDYRQKNPQHIVQVESQTIDTGERKIFFDQSAKHFRTTIKVRPGDGFGGGEEIVDGWYIDHESSDNACAPDYVHTDPYYAVGTTLVMYPEVAQFHHTGPLPTGLAVKLTTSLKLAGIKDGTRGRRLTIEKTVEELSDSPISPSLFELPSGFHENPQLFKSHSVSSQ
jgi:hypothetical protein